MQMTAGARAIYGEFQNPSKNGVRLPTYPDLQKTSIYSQVENGTYGVASNDAVMAVIRDATFPLWAKVGTTASSSPPITTNSQQIVYGIGGINTTAATDREVPLDEVWEIDQAQWEVVDLQTGGVPATGILVGMTGSLSMFCGTPVTAVFPNVDERPWMYVPNGWSFGFSLAMGPAAVAYGVAGVTATVTVELAGGPELKYSDYRMVASTAMTGLSLSCGQFAQSAVTTEAGRLGFWARLKSVELKTTAGDASHESVKPYVSLWTLGVSTVTLVPAADDKQCTITAAAGFTIRTAFQPLVNMATNRSTATSASSLVASASKVVSTMLQLSNSTKVMNQEGTFNCLRYYENGIHGLTKPPSSFNGFNPEDRAFRRMAAGLRTAVRPSHELDYFEDIRVSYGAGPLGIAGTFWPALRLWKNQHINYIKLEDQDSVTVTSMNYTLRQNIEFVNNDVLLKPAYSNYEIEDLHKAVKAFCRAPLWISGDVQHFNLVDRNTEGMPRIGTSRAGPGKRAPAPRKARPARAKKPVPKPAAKKQGKGQRARPQPPRR